MESIGIVDILGEMNEYSGAGGVRINVMVIIVECKFLVIILAVCIFEMFR